MNGNLYYSKIKNFYSGSIEVKCYDNGLFFSCPDPRDEYRRKLAKEAYNKGHFIDCITLKLTEEQFKDENNWTPTR